MITLITGAPGAGKTAALVDLLTQLGKDRAIYVHGIPDLSIDHQPLPDPATWPDTVPDGSIIVIDEVQTIWRPSGPGQKIPDHIAKLETHRHRGLDFYIITQGPNLVHSNVRALVGRHIHLRDIGFLGRWWYEWPETADNCRTGWKTAPIKKKYKLPKRIFGQYKSASIHVKPVRSFPKVIIVLILALLVAGYLAWTVFGKISEKIAPLEIKPLAPVSAPGQATRDALQSTPEPVRLGYIDDRVDFNPRVSHVPESAPAYDGLRQIVNMPVLSGGVCKGSECKCFTQQGTPLAMSSDECKRMIQNPVFDHYNRPQPVKVEALASGIPLANTPSGQAGNLPAPAPTAIEVPMPAGRSLNPTAEAKTPLTLPPGSPVQPTPAMGTAGTMPALSLQNPYRRS